MVVCAAVHRCRGDLDFQPLAVNARQRVLSLAWLQVDFQNEVIALPVIPGFWHRYSKE